MTLGREVSTLDVINISRLWLSLMTMRRELRDLNDTNSLGVLLK